MEMKEKILFSFHITIWDIINYKLRIYDYKSLSESDKQCRRTWTYMGGQDKVWTLKGNITPLIIQENNL